MPLVEHLTGACDPATVAIQDRDRSWDPADTDTSRVFPDLSGDRSLLTLLRRDPEAAATAASRMLTVQDLEPAQRNTRHALVIMCAALGGDLEEASRQADQQLDDPRWNKIVGQWIAVEKARRIGPQAAARASAEAKADLASIERWTGFLRIATQAVVDGGIES